MKKTALLSTFLFASIGIISSGSAEQRIPAMHVTDPPVIDGIAAEKAWERAREIITHDKVGKLDISLKAVYTENEIFLLVRFPDPDESRNHKSWTWNKSQGIYSVGHDREDIFVIKWNMLPEPVDLSIYAENPYQADIWYWKAHRTDRAGYADDKLHILSPANKENAIKITSKSGKSMYLLRREDDGKSAYKVNLITEFQGESLPRFISQDPTGSRSDVQAKGTWDNGTWTIEFRRKLTTGHRDDIQFAPGNRYLFGVSRYEIAGRGINHRLSDPLYGNGDINETLWLEFAKE
ncbi:ethylbenzene dehydrogenase-related protein [Thermodesulfobacteriota bacterium]